MPLEEDARRALEKFRADAQLEEAQAARAKGKAEESARDAFHKAESLALERASRALGQWAGRMGNYQPAKIRMTYRKPYTSHEGGTFGEIGWDVHHSASGTSIPNRQDRL